MATARKAASPYGEKKFASIDEYHASFPPATRVLLDQLRAAIGQTAPAATETISYNIPTFRLRKNLVHYAAFKQHIGFYPAPSAVEAFKTELAKYTTSKGAVQFPAGKPLPLALIKKIVRFRLDEENTAVRARAKNGCAKEITAYNNSQAKADKEICNLLSKTICQELPEAENKIWHAHPVWFLDGNPVVGYSKLKTGIRLLFWSGQSFNTTGLRKEGSFKAAEARYNALSEVDTALLRQWLKMAREIQWDYKNLVKRKGKLERLK